MTMFFKKKEWSHMSYWGLAHQVKRKYARRLADWLNRRVAGVPVKKLRFYVAASLIGMALLNGAMGVHMIRQYRHGLVSVSSFIRHLPPVPPMRSLRFDDRLYDSLEKLRPGLADSLKILERLH